MTDKVKLYAVKNDEGKYWDFRRGKWSTNTDGDFTCSLTIAKLKKLKDGDSDHVVELTEKQKVKLPQDVGKELDDWMADNQDGWGGRIGDLIDDITTYEPELSNVVDFADDSEENYFKVIDAYRYGWEAEKESMYDVKVPLLSKKWFIVNADGELDSVGNRNFATHFSMEAINEYGLQNCECVEVTDDDAKK